MAWLQLTGFETSTCPVQNTHLEYRAEQCSYDLQLGQLACEVKVLAWDTLAGPGRTPARWLAPTHRPRTAFWWAVRARWPGRSLQRLSDRCRRAWTTRSESACSPCDTVLWSTSDGHFLLVLVILGLLMGFGGCASELRDRNQWNVLEGMS